MHRFFLNEFLSLKIRLLGFNNVFCTITGIEYRLQSTNMLH